MKKSTIWFLAITMAVTFAGLLFTQFMYMENMIKMRKEQFKEAAQRSLYTVSTMLEEDEAQQFLTEALEDDLMLHHHHDIGDIVVQPQLAITAPDGSVTTFTFNNIKDRALALKSRPSLRGQSKIPAPMMNAYKNMQELLRSQYLYQRGLIDDVIINILGQASSKPILERIDTRKLGYYLKTEFENNGLNLPFEYAVIDNKGRVVYDSADYNPAVSRNMLFSQIIFPNDPPGRRNTLRVYFPTQNDYLFDSVRFIIPSFIFTLIMLITFTFTIIVVFRQKKLTDMKNDFINNMTHEFKTPISTISLAAQMLNDPAMSKSPAMFKHISGVINDETKRLRLQVEKVLQMSMFDRQKTQLKLHNVDVNDLIAGVMSTFKIKVEKFGGTIDADLPAEDMIVAVDEMHFTNVIFNLLDNAVKYRREEVPLSLFISTRILS
ncbi:MAG: HAMP domain-containing histidine kinase, partial [Bacteroidaceae bacterium]|nr:HAMP domain-containing histidine kinase [Bacteroidaceae bacterium]